MLGTIFGLILIGLGVFIIFDVNKNGVTDPETNKAKMIVAIIGEKGAKGFYRVLGAICILAGIGTIIGQITS